MDTRRPFIPPDPPPPPPQKLLPPSSGAHRSVVIVVLMALAFAAGLMLRSLTGWSAMPMHPERVCVDLATVPQPDGGAGGSDGSAGGADQPRAATGEGTP